MKHTRFTKSIIQAVLILLGTITFTLPVLSAFTHYDNKYITKARLAQDHFSIIPEKGYCALVDGWELYPDVLLSWKTFLPKHSFFIPHGQANTQISPYFTQTKILTELLPGVCIFGATAMSRSIFRSLSAPQNSLSMASVWGVQVMCPGKLYPLHSGYRLFLFPE